MKSKLIPAQVLYDLRQEMEFCSGTDLAEFFSKELGDPSPKGKTIVGKTKAQGFVSRCIDAWAQNSSLGKKEANALKAHAEKALR